MRVEKIVMKNYRQYRDCELSFARLSETGLYMVIGINGTGKTNLINAINWCLYGDEPHLSKESERLPMLNLNTIEHAEEGEKSQIYVELWMRADGNERITFSRKVDYHLHGNSLPSPSSSEFQVKLTDDKGNTKILTGEEADDMVKRIVPLGLREFFFFDGERLDKYFREATGERIKDAVFRISQIYLLEIVRDHLDRVLGDFQKEAGRLSPNVEQIRKELKQRESERYDKNQRIEACRNQIETAKNKISEYRDKLTGIPDMGELQKERDTLHTRRKETENAREDRAREIESLLFELTKSVMLYTAIDQSLAVIEEKEKKQEIPPTMDGRLIERILDDGNCICSRPLNEEARKKLESLLGEVRMTSEVGNRLLSMSYPLHEAKSRIDSLWTSLSKLHGDIEIYEHRLNEITQNLSKVEQKIGTHNVEKIAECYGELKKFEEIYETKSQELGATKAELPKLEGRIDTLNQELRKELGKARNLEEVTKRIDFVQSAWQAITRSEKYIMDEVRGEIEAETGNLFFDLIWKKETFKNVYIDDDFNLHLIHTIGFDSLGSVSAGERELLALSFTIALHKISGFDFPIFMDTPVARMSPEHRRRFAEIFLRLGATTQIVLLMLPAPSEYSDEMKEVLDPIASKYELRLSPDEKEVKV